MRILTLLLLSGACLGTLVAQHFTDTTVIYSPGFDHESMIVPETDLLGTPDLVVLNDNALILFAATEEGIIVTDTLETSFLSSFEEAKDYNGDGLLDYLGSNGIAYGQSDGELSPVTSGGGASSGDFNGDGVMDFFSVRGLTFENDTARLSLSQPDGSYLRENVYDEAYRVESSVAGDVNNDGKVDFCFIAQFIGEDDQLICLIGDGAGGYTTESIAGQQIADGALQLADLNGDGFPEAIMRQDLFPGLIYINNNNGSFENANIVTVEDDDYRYKVIKTADLDGDGDQDIVAIIQFLSEDEDQVAYLINDGNGNFGPQTIVTSFFSFNVGSFPGNQANTRLYLTDLDGDFFPDIVVNAGRMNETFVLFNTLTSSTNELPTGFAGKMSVYPNPVGQSASLRMDFPGRNDQVIDQIMLIDALGRIVESNWSVNSRSLRINDLANGAYVLFARNEQGEWFRSRFVK